MAGNALYVARSGARIGIPEGSSQTIVFAADQLSYYLALLTGAQFRVEESDQAIRLTVDESAEPGSHSLQVTAEGMHISGADELALLHGVYHFLETKCGCRWLSSFEGGEIIPRDEQLSIEACRETHRPVFAHRAFTNFPDIDERTVEMVDWMCKNRFNRFMIFSNVSDAFERYQRVLKPHLVLRGMKVEMGHHSFRYWLPPEEFFAGHPEWYAQVDGKRVADAQLCTANAEVAPVVARRICEFLAANPEIDMVGLWPNDGFGWCECEKCREIEPQRESTLRKPLPARTDTYIRFVNEVAQAVARQHPDRRLSALAYVNYVEPPTIELHPNVDVCYAAMNRCIKHPFQGGEGCIKDNAAYAEYFDRWRELVPGKLYLFCYLMQIDMCSIPYPIAPMLGPNFRWLAEHGCDGYVMEFKPEEWGPFGVNAHIIGRLSWDAYFDPEQWLGEYYPDLFGPAADEMLAFHRAIVDAFRRLAPCVYHYDLGYTRIATHELLTPALEHLGKARALAATGEKRHRQAVERVHLGIVLMMKMGEWQRVLVEARPASGDKREVLVRRAKRLGEELVLWTKANGSSDAIFAPRIETIVGRTHEGL